MSLKKAEWICILFLGFLPLLNGEVINLSDSSSDSGWCSVAVNDNGVVLAVWIEELQIGVRQIFYTTYTPDRGWVDPKNTLLRRQTVDFCQLAVDSNGIFHLCYSDGFDSSSRDIYYSTYNPATDEWLRPAEMVYRSEENSAWARIDIEGNFVYICWFHEHGVPYEPDVFLIRKTIGGKWPATPEDVSRDAAHGSTHPAFRVKNGNIYVNWMHNIGAPEPPFIWKIWYTEKVSGQWADTFQLGDSHWPALEIDDNNKSGTPVNVHCLYPSKGMNFGSMHYTSRIDGKWVSDVSINDSHSEPGFADIRYKNKTLVAVFVQVALDRSGNTIVLKKKTYNNGWGGWSPATIIAYANNPQDMAYPEFPQMWLDSSGYAHMVWVDQKDFSSEQHDVFYSKVKVFEGKPSIHLDRSSLSFTAKESGDNPSSQIFKIRNKGGETLNYSITTDSSWLSVSPTSGTSTGEYDDITVSVSLGNLEEGSYTGKIQVTSPNADNSPQQLTVNLKVEPPVIYAPLNFKAEKLENKSLFLRETLHKLKWEANPKNKNISNYRIYEVQDNSAIKVAEVDSNTFEYLRRHTDKSRQYTYRVTAVDSKGREGAYAELNI